MGLYLTLTAGLALWIVLWAIGVKGFDGFMITVVMVVIAAAMRLVWMYMPGNRNPDNRPS